MARNASSVSPKTQRKVKQQYGELIRSVRWIHGIGQDLLRKVFSVGYDIAELAHYPPLAARIIEPAYQRVVQGLPPALFRIKISKTITAAVSTTNCMQSATRAAHKPPIKV